MPETVYRESRSYTRERDDHSSDDDRYSRTTPTVRRYKVTTTANRAAPPPPPPVEFERTERIIERDYDVEDDRRSRFSSHTHHSHHPGRSSGDLLEIDTTRRIERAYPPERPHSAFEPPVRNTTVVEKVIERERPPVQDFYDITRRSTVKDDGRTVIYEKTKEVEREHDRSPVHEYYDITRRSTVKDDGRSILYEKTREVERDDAYPPPSERSRTVVEKKFVEREDDRWYDDRDRARTVIEKKVVERERHDDPWYDDRDRARTVIEKRIVERDDGRHWDDRDRSLYEQTTEIERQRGPTSPRTPRDWDHHSHSPWDRDNVDVRLERRIERRDDGVDVTIQRRTEERHDETPHGEYQQYRRETEYFEPPPREPAPIIIRPPALEQRIIVQDAPEPAPIVVPYRQPETAVARRPDPREEDEYYYRRREIERYDGRRDREDDYAMYRHGRERDHHGDGYASDDDVIVRRTIIRRERSKSPNHHHRLHLAEGAVAGAGLAALAASRKSADGQPSRGRGRKVLAGAALGALGTEVFKRTRSAYQDRHGSDEERYYEDRIIRGRSRSRPGERLHDDDDYYYDDDDKKDKHSKLKTGLGLAAAALAVAGAAKYYQSQKVEKEELRRGRSRNRRSDYSDSDDGYYSRSHSRGPGPKPSGGGTKGVAAAAAGTAAVAGLVHHIRSKSRQRKEDGKPGSKSRSRSRLRTGAEIVAAGLVGAAGKRLYDQRKERKEAEREREFSDEEYERGLRERSRSRSRPSRRDRSRSRSRSVPRSRSRSRTPSYPTTAAADPELGLVEYGNYPLYPDPPYPEEHGYGPAPVDAAEERRRRRAERLARKQRERQRSRSRAESSADDTTYDDSDKKEKKARSRSRLRDLATGAVAAGAAAIGVNKYNEHKKEERRTKSRERTESEERSISRDAREQRRAERERARRDRDKARNHYEDSIASDPHDNYNHQQPPSPPTMSGGAYYGPPQTPPVAHQDPPPVNTSYGQGFTQHPNMASTDLNNGYRAYNPQEYAAFPGPPPGPPPNTATTPTGMPPPPTGGHRPLDPDHVSRENGLNKPPPYRSRDPSPVSSISSSGLYTPPRTPSPPAATQSHVQFGPLSPQSSQTLLRHRATRSGENVNNTKSAEEQEMQQDGTVSDAESAIVPQRRFRKRRRNSDPSANRPLVSRHRGGPVESDRSSSPSEEEIEVLPDRFDPQGRLLDGSAAPGSSGSRHRGWTQRRGEFEYRSPRPGAPQVRGSWGVAGTDPEHVERVMREVTGALSGGIPQGVGGWLGLAGKLFGSAMGGHALLHNEEGQGGEEPSGRGAGARRRRDAGEGRSGRRGWKDEDGYGDERDDRGAIGYDGGGSEVSRDERGKGRRRVDDHGYDNNEDESDVAREEARRRRTRRRRDMD